jgi:hypothetical protein
MFKGKTYLGILGIAAVISGMLLFLIGKDYSPNWTHWVFGPLLWCMGGALVFAWIVSVFTQAPSDEKADAKTSAKPLGRAS